MRKNSLIKSLVLAVVAGVGHAASASIVYSSNGFENPPYTAGNLAGQDAWVQSGGAANSAIVGSGTGTSSSQGVTVSYSGTSATADARYFPGTTSVTPTLTNNVVNVDWDTNVPQATGAQPFGPFFGIEVYDAGNNRLAGVGMDAKTGELLFENPAASPPDALTPFGGDPHATFGAYHHYSLSMNYTTQTASLTVDGVTAGSFAFQTASSTFSDADISALAAQNDSETGSAVFDNYVVTLVPEPTTLAAFAFSGLLLLRRRAR